MALGILQLDDLSKKESELETLTITPPELEH